MIVSKLVLPEEVHSLREFRQRELPGFATVNIALQAFEFKALFPWHLSVLIRYVDCIEHRLPSDDEQKLLYSFEGRLDPLIKANNNALFLARVTHDCFREIIWRVRDPDAVDAVLRQILSNKDYRREFDYRIDDDPKWEKAAWHLGSRPTAH
ncbi:DUF695 domain-containing protein [Bradyrhizobium sp. CCBAU 51753]|uniref:DUF695 domain-containing protein n=1 Tax=Bradyrhizobium sp. CCBAU 51753 TaxID=1325100 RepID=UPI00188BE78C|nr:DUF695 domain-containing protein [Bradyrhizobium sp. CCBAU 51753]QOZ24932.1 DUF695 domain-containing protein [Bradyrhizobium sp. CCBAU 51753]